MKIISYKLGKLFSALFILCLCFTSCDFEYELPEAGSIADATLPSAAFTSSQTDPDDFRIVTFTNESASATSYAWDFGGGNTSTEANPMFTFEAGEGTYPVTLSISDNNGVTDVITKNIVVIEPEEPDAIVPTVLNGDFTEGQDDWKVSSFTGGTTSPFNSSSDGSPIDYDGNDTGAKTPGAKWTMSTSAGPLASGDSRYAYQAFTVSANTVYVLEWEYAIKDDPAIEVPDGDRCYVEILDGHFSDGAGAVDAIKLSTTECKEALGKGNFTRVEAEFETNDSGEIAIWIWAVTAEDLYVDNVKLTPKL